MQVKYLSQHSDYQKMSRDAQKDGNGDRKGFCIEYFNHMYLVFATLAKKGARDPRNILVTSSHYVTIRKIKPLANNNAVTN